MGETISSTSFIFVSVLGGTNFQNLDSRDTAGLLKADTIASSPLKSLFYSHEENRNENAFARKIARSLFERYDLTLCNATTMWITLQIFSGI